MSTSLGQTKFIFLVILTTFLQIRGLEDDPEFPKLTRRTQNSRNAVLPKNQPRQIVYEQGPGDTRYELPGVLSQWSTQWSPKRCMTTANRRVHLGVVIRVLWRANHVGVADFRVHVVTTGPMDPTTNDTAGLPRPHSSRDTPTLPFDGLGGLGSLGVRHVV